MPFPYWTSEYTSLGAYYNIFTTDETKAMDALRMLFPSGTADSMSFCLFSTSGVHGTYQTIEDAEQTLLKYYIDEDGDPIVAQVTFLVVHPRLVCLRYGNCLPKTPDDIAFLKRLRQTSWSIVAKIG